MLFTSLALVGLAALATAAPRPDVPIEERGLTWDSRGLERRGRGSHRNNNDVTIVDTTFVQIDEKTRGEEEELTVLIKKKTIIKDDKNKFRDNVRRNHYRNKNRDENTVIIIVTKVIDIRDSSNRNTRYVQRQIRADNKKNKDVIIMVTEVVAITIDSNSGRGNRRGSGHGGKRALSTSTSIPASTSASASASIPIVTIAANATYAASNVTMVMPSGAPPPSLAGVGVDFDPAAIIEEDQALFVDQASS